MLTQPAYGTQPNEALAFQQHLAYEDGIVWAEDTTGLDYGRQSLVSFASTRRRPVGWTGTGRRVGYSVLRDDAPSAEGTPGRFVRRLFWGKGNDRSEQPNGTYRNTAPAEAIDPRPVVPGVWGLVPDRAWNAASTGTGHTGQPPMMVRGPPRVRTCS